MPIVGLINFGRRKDNARSDKTQAFQRGTSCYWIFRIVFATKKKDTNLVKRTIETKSNGINNDNFISQEKSYYTIFIAHPYHRDCFERNIITQ